jgi:hypothetical protein
MQTTARRRWGYTSWRKGEKPEESLAVGEGGNLYLVYSIRERFSTVIASFPISTRPREGEVTVALPFSFNSRASASRRSCESSCNADCTALASLMNLGPNTFMSKSISSVARSTGLRGDSAAPSERTGPLVESIVAE